MGWSELTGREDQQERAQQERERMAALEKACIQALKGRNQAPLRQLLFRKAQGVSYRPGAPAEQVAFDEGQRSMALQILKLAGELHE